MGNLPREATSSRISVGSTRSTEHTGHTAGQGQGRMSHRDGHLLLINSCVKAFGVLGGGIWPA